LAELIGGRARHADLVILPQPYGADRKAESELALECALFDGHAPVLVLAKGSPLVKKAKTIVIAWNQSAGAMAAVRAALPLLQNAKSVKIAVINPGVHDPERSDPGGMLCQFLSRHGVHADVAVLAKTLPKISEVLNRFITDQNADLLVMGAYGHSRLRESLFGGATRDMLDTNTIPVLMAH
jgi:nucleotide-binding universal stress UspA family protein